MPEPDGFADERDCPSLDSLAAFLEGKVTGIGERRALLRHLVLCRRCYLIFCETLRSMEEGSDLR